ncbi:hypothetical protein [Amycolatopsis sp. YIM 10]|uniref:hypothetical protein n=1 Tax=Amycolatopsis sp. YIM 10 TaxID=2653857 RepID=UPI00129013EB|nr:hypothetical protein [Amycolatopsis sp. YIM 10]QFU87531.1 hypothetical protein YIM_11690 [Amycolatopsis sp. YIM 10]
MTRGTALLPYPEWRVLEDAFGRGLQPMRLFALLLPVWQVEIKAVVVEEEPYQLIDRFIERGIVEGDLGNVDELARFFALDPPIVDRALRFLAAIGHVTWHDGRLRLTRLGLDSQRDQVCYKLTREDRRKLYFDAFRSRPLGKAYYDASSARLLSLPEVRAAASGGYRRFLMLGVQSGFRREALAELANHADRERYNLPVRIAQAQSLGEDLVYLPLYVVRAIEKNGRPRYLAYSQPADGADPELTELCEDSAEISGLLNREEIANGSESPEEQIAAWLRRKGLEKFRPAREDDGSWQLTLPSEAFKPVGPLPLNLLGSFQALTTCVVRLRCDDKAARERTLLRRADFYLTPRSRITASDVETWVGRTARQLDLAVNVSELCELAAKSGKNGLVDRIKDLWSET